jgi:hypothetical protein
VFDEESTDASASPLRSDRDEVQLCALGEVPTDESDADNALAVGSMEAVVVVALGGGYVVVDRIGITEPIGKGLQDAPDVGAALCRCDFDGHAAVVASDRRREPLVRPGRGSLPDGGETRQAQSR